MKTNILEKIDLFLKESKSGDKEAYTNFFNKMLKKYKVKSPAELSDNEKKKFFNDVKAGWKGSAELNQ